MKIMIDFFRTMLMMPAHWLFWIGLLIAANLIVPLFFLATVEARVVIAAISVGALVQFVIFGAKGFVRLLGLGHIVAWVPMLPWLWTRLELAPPGSAFKGWMMAVIVLDVLSLAIDFSDVYRYLNKGERAPQLVLGKG